MKTKKSNSFLSRYLRAAFTFIPGKPAYYRGLRVALIIGIPFLLGMHFGMLRDASLFVLAALNVTLIDMGGLTYRKLFRILLLTTLLNAAAAIVAILVGSNIILAVTITAIWLASVALLGFLGHTGVMMAFVNSVVFVIMVALPGDHTMILRPFIIFLAGGFWTMLFSLVAWPISPYRPIRKAVARCFVENANFLRNIAEVCQNETLNNISDADQNISDIIHRRFRDSVDEAHEMLINERKGRMGNTDVEDALVSLLHSVAKDYRTLVTTIVWFKNEGKNIHVSNSKSLSDLFSELADIHDEIANLIIHAKTNKKLLIDSLTVLKEKYLYSENKIVVGQSKEIHHILEQILNRFELEIVTAKKQHPSHISTKDNNRQKSLMVDDKTPFLRLIQINLTISSPGFRHSIRIGVTAAIAVLIAHLTHLPRGYWLPLTVVVIMAPDFGGSFLVRSLQRGVGTILGGLMAAFILVQVQDEMIIFGLLVLFTFLAISLLTINYALFVFFLTPLIVTMYGLSDIGDWHISYDRVLDTLLGIALTLLGGRLLFPVWERNIYVKRFATMLEAINKYINSVLETLEGKQQSSINLIVLLRKIETASSNANASFQQALNQPGFNTKLIPQLMSFLNLSNRLIRGITSMNEYFEVNTNQLSKNDTLILAGNSMSDLINLMAQIISIQEPDKVKFDDKTIKMLKELDKLIKEITKTQIDLTNFSSSEKNVTTIEIKRLLEIEQNMVVVINSITSINMGLSAEDDYFAA